MVTFTPRPVYYRVETLVSILFDARGRQILTGRFEGGKNYSSPLRNEIQILLYSNLRPD